MTESEQREDAGPVTDEEVPEDRRGDDPGDDAALPEPIEAVLEEVPPEQREKVRSTFLGLSQYMGPVPHPLFRKLAVVFAGGIGVGVGFLSKPRS